MQKEENIFALNRSSRAKIHRLFHLGGFALNATFRPVVFHQQDAPLAGCLPKYRMFQPHGLWHLKWRRLAINCPSLLAIEAHTGFLKMFH